MKILICPLNWGLGHATRCVPIIRKYLSDRHEVVLAADGYPLEFLKLEFPELETLELPSYPVRYSAGNSQIMAMARNLPSILKGIYCEHIWLRKLLKIDHFDLVISDNRFGLWTKQTNCIYMTHQLMIKMPKWLKTLEPLAWWLHRQIINRYNKCWIPDYKENGGLSGDLAHKYSLPKNAEFIGTLSRFLEPENYKPDTTFDVVAIVSGIEPQRTLFENEMVQRFAKSNEKTLILCGKPTAKNSRLQIGNICFATHIADAELAPYLIGSKKIIARSGYSTIMDLHVLNCLEKAELIPTPGQTEQEFLAGYINERKSQFSPSTV
jgi:predicted glycosyltransferase